MKRVKRSKKQDERNVNVPFMTLHNDMNVEILMKLPPGSIARLRFASKHLSSIILGKEFTELYRTRSLTQPRHLVSVHGGHRYVSCSVDRYGPRLASYDFTPPVHGLIFGRNCSKMVVGNPSTVNDVYKVLCMTVVTKRSNISRGVTPCDAMPEVHQVITLGAKEKWRMIECKYPYHHYPGCQEICRDGVIYYLASYKGKRSLMRFDLSSEDFNITKLPEDLALQWFGELVNHAGKITIAALRCGPVDLWVLEDVNKEVWSKTVVVVPSLPDRFGISHKFVFKGILGSLDNFRREILKVIKPSCTDPSPTPANTQPPATPLSRTTPVVCTTHVDACNIIKNAMRFANQDTSQSSEVHRVEGHEDGEQHIAVGNPNASGDDIVSHTEASATEGAPVGTHDSTGVVGDMVSHTEGYGAEGPPVGTHDASGAVDELVSFSFISGQCCPFFHLAISIRPLTVALNVSEYV
ncbi:hypothetical protein Bca52824_085936 [Brassica carinata]|uniref:F-box associated beta-propeller type 3 domain-containing protein n=1 Tax=Brassica carinata TaxID=52824 RepID=A0A8X7P968_BRACI|nr:hypothetical protein Bca52824_085936 [Brassica carinata]